MGDVIVVFKIIPDEFEETENVKKALEELKPDKLEDEAIAFGLKSFKFTKIVPDAEGGLTEIENKLNSIPHANVELITASRTF